MNQAWEAAKRNLVFEEWNTIPDMVYEIDLYLTNWVTETQASEAGAVLRRKGSSAADRSKAADILNRYRMQ